MVTATIIRQNNFISLKCDKHITRPGLGSGNEKRQNLGLERDHYLMEVHRELPF